MYLHRMQIIGFVLILLYYNANALPSVEFVREFVLKHQRSSVVVHIPETLSLHECMKWLVYPWFTHECIKINFWTIFLLLRTFNSLTYQAQVSMISCFYMFVTFITIFFFFSSSDHCSILTTFEILMDLASTNFYIKYNPSYIIKPIFGLVSV